MKHPTYIQPTLRVLTAGRYGFACPVHPHERADEIRHCSKCGLAFESRASLGAPRERLPMEAKLRWQYALAMTVLLFGLVVAEWFPGSPFLDAFEHRSAKLFALGIATPVCLWAAWPLYRIAMRSVRRAQPDMSILIGVGILSSYSYSMASTFWPNGFPASYRDGHGDVAGYFLVSSAIVTLSLLGRALERRSFSATSTISDRTAGAERNHAGGRQNLSDMASGAYLAVVVVVAVVAFAAWSLAAPESGLVSGVLGLVGVLLVACPLGVGLIAPLSMGIASRKGVSIGVAFADAKAIQALQAVDTIVVARSGTLVRGFPKVVAIEPVGSMDRMELLRLAASLESGCRHPIALAIVKDSVSEGLRLGEPSEIESIAGKGLRGNVDGRSVAVGNLSMMEHHGLALGELAMRAEVKRAEGMNTVYVAVDGVPAGIISFSDAIVESAPSAVRALRKSGLRVVMLTGESRTTAEELAQRLGIDEVLPETRPQDRLHAIDELRRNGWKVAVMGEAMDGSEGGVGRPVTISIGSDIGSRMVATVTVAVGGLHGVAKARSLAVATMGSIRQNLIVAFGFAGVGVVVAAGAFYPSLGIRLSPGIVAAVACAGAVGVAVGVLRLRSAEL